MERRHPNVINLAELESKPMHMSERFSSATKNLGIATGSRGIGCSHYELAPGKAAFPRHYHCANEESIYVLEGEGTLRLGDAEVAVRAGDYATFPVGPAHAHQLRNTSEAPLRFLCFSTLLPVEVVGYPDSEKIGAAGAPGVRETPWVRALFRQGSQVGYLDGEPE